jgi:hypothetical protein
MMINQSTKGTKTLPDTNGAEVEWFSSLAVDHSVKDTLTTRTTIDRQAWCSNMPGILEIEHSLRYSTLIALVKAIAKSRSRLN